jgi:hypothetical protein
MTSCFCHLEVSLSPQPDNKHTVYVCIRVQSSVIHAFSFSRRYSSLCFGLLNSSLPCFSILSHLTPIPGLLWHHSPTLLQLVSTLTVAIFLYPFLQHSQSIPFIIIMMYKKGYACFLYLCPSSARVATIFLLLFYFLCYVQPYYLCLYISNCICLFHSQIYFPVSSYSATPILNIIWAMYFPHYFLVLCTFFRRLWYIANW